MTNDFSRHKTILFQILKDIYKDRALAPFLGFKGGTAAAMFYGLNRVSLDLDFDLLDESKLNQVFSKIGGILSKYGTVKEESNKRFNLFWLLSYEEKGKHIKIEVNKRQFGSKFEVTNYLGLPVLVMSKDDMFANKLMAMYERIGKTSRDIYDVWFFLDKRFPINKEIVEKRSGMHFEKLVGVCIEKLEKLNNRKILDGVGELLAPSQKDWARAKLKSETISLLQLRVPGL